MSFGSSEIGLHILLTLGPRDMYFAMTLTRLSLSGNIPKREEILKIQRETIAFQQHWLKILSKIVTLSSAEGSLILRTIESPTEF